MVVNGRADGVGVDRNEIESLIGRQPGPAGPAMTLHGDKVAVAAAAARRRADVWLVRYDPHIVEVPVARGENAGRTLPHTTSSAC